MCESMCLVEAQGRNESKGRTRRRLSWDPSLAGGAPTTRPFRFIGWAESEHTRWDPKDGDLCPGRTKTEETLVEVRSGSDVQIDRQT